MPRTYTLTVPDALAERVELIAQTAGASVEEVLRLWVTEKALTLPDPSSLFLDPSDRQGVHHVAPRSNLHEAMALVLKERGGAMHAKELAEEIERRDLYRMRSGRPPRYQQLVARANNYKQTFEMRGGNVIALRKFPIAATR